MASHSPFKLPNELLISSLCSQYPCREGQIRTLSTLLSSYFLPPDNIVLYGLECTGKSDIIAALLSTLSSQNDNGSSNNITYSIVKSAECITGRHLLESTVGAIAAAVGWEKSVARCENVAQLAVEVNRFMEYRDVKKSGGKGLNSDPRFVLVFDGIDRQRDAPTTLLAGLARLGEIIPSLTTIFTVKSPRPHFLHVSSVLHIHFPAYTKSETVSILSLNVRPIWPESSGRSPDPKEVKETADLWSRFVSAVWDSLAKHSGRDIVSLRAICTYLWPSFTSLIRDNTYGPKDFTRILVAKRSLLQDERLLIPSITSSPLSPKAVTDGPQLASQSRPDKQPKGTQSITTQLPLTPRLLLIAAYLASYTPARLDLALFSKSSHPSQKRRRKNLSSLSSTATSHSVPGASKTGTRTRHRKIPRTLLGPQAFVLERLLAIFAAVRQESSVGRGHGSGGMTADVGMAVATLASLRLLIRTGSAADALEGGTKYRVNVGWEVVRGVARSVGVEVEDFVVE